MATTDTLFQYLVSYIFGDCNGMSMSSTAVFEYVIVGKDNSWQSHMLNATSLASRMKASKHANANIRPGSHVLLCNSKTTNVQEPCYRSAAMLVAKSGLKSHCH